MKPSTPLIRPANRADAAMLWSLVRDCVAAMQMAGIEQWDEIYPNTHHIAADLEAGSLHALCDDTSIIGCLTVDTHMDPLWQGMNWSEEGEPAAAVHRLMVHPSRQGQGLAKRLMLHAETLAAAKGCRSIRLDSFLQNPIAMALYIRLGYRQTGLARMRKGEFAGFEKLLNPPAPI